MKNISAQQKAFVHAERRMYEYTSAIPALRFYDPAIWPLVHQWQAYQRAKLAVLPIRPYGLGV